MQIHELPQRLTDLRAALNAAGCSTRILAGGEVAVSAVRGLDDHELAVVSDRGYRALIAHPERHLGAHLVKRLAGLIQRGALVQATAASFTAEESRDGMLALARAGVLHVLGSDSHSARAGRPVAIAAALRELRTVESLAGHLKWIGRTAPAAIVRGAEVRPPFPTRFS